MGKEQFEAIMPYISADLISKIIDEDSLSEEEAIQKLYTSKLYSLLEKENTKVWHYSTPMLYSLLKQEEATGNIVFPDV